jgi:hypothetical protein
LLFFPGFSHFIAAFGKDLRSPSPFGEDAEKRSFPKAFYLHAFPVAMKTAGSSQADDRNKRANGRNNQASGKIKRADDGMNRADGRINQADVKMNRADDGNKRATAGNKQETGGSKRMKGIINCEL